MATLVAAGLIAASSATAYGDSYSWDGRTTHYVGVKINYGDGWIGSYRLNNRTHHGSTGQFYCADPEKDGPSAGGTYQSRGSTTRWARDGGGSLSRRRFHKSPGSWASGMPRRIIGRRPLLMPQCTHWRGSQPISWVLVLMGVIDLMRPV